MLEWCEQVSLVPINSKGRCTLEKPFGTSKIVILLCRHSTASEIKYSRVPSLETGSDQYVWHENMCGRTLVKERRGKPKPRELRKIRLEIVPLLTSRALEASNILEPLETESSLRTVEKLLRSFQDLVGRAKVHHFPRKNGKGGND